MKRTQRLLIILCEPLLTYKITDVISGFHAVSIIKHISPEVLETVYYYNKNAVYLTSVFDMSWSIYNPIIIRVGRKTNIDMTVLGIDNIIQDFPKVLDYYDIDVGDHSIEDSTQINAQETNECLLCNIYRKNTVNVEHILYQTNYFYVVPGTGAFFDGYVMIVPKRHTMSFALLLPDEMEEFFNLLNDIRSILEAIYGKKIFAFECGSGKTGSGKHKSSIVHAHMHLAPSSIPVLKEVQKSGLHPALIDKYSISKYGEYPYMLYIDQADNWYISSDPNSYYPRQHPRQVLANWMGCYELYNWRLYPFRERMDVIAKEFREYCHNNFTTLPRWVQQSVKFDD